MRLELSRKAQTDLDGIRDFSVEQFGAARTIDYLDAIEDSFRRILAFPEIGAVHASLPSMMRSIACGQHRVFYALLGETIQITRILHKSMDAGRHLVD